MKKSFGIELFGFNKKDVSNYIQKLSLQAKEYDSELMTKFDLLSKEYNDLQEKICKYELKLKELESALESETKTNECLRADFSALCKSLRSTIDSFEKEL